MTFQIVVINQVQNSYLKKVIQKIITSLLGGNKVAILTIFTYYVWIKHTKLLTVPSFRRETVYRRSRTRREMEEFLVFAFTYS